LAQEKKNVRMVFVSLAWNSEIPFRAALARGYFKQQGLSIEPILIRGGPAAIAALISGEVDFAAIGGAQAVFPQPGTGIGYIDSRLHVEHDQLHFARQQTDAYGGRPQRQDDWCDRRRNVFRIRRESIPQKHNINPDKDVTLRAIGGTVLRAAAIEKGIIAAAPFSPEDGVRLIKAGYSVISNLSESLGIPQNIIVTRNEVLEKFPDMSKRVLKAYIQGMQLAKFNKREAIKAGYESGLAGDLEIVNAAYDLYAPGLTADLSIVTGGLQQMLDEDIRAGLVDKNFTLDRVVNDRILKIAQQELRAEGRLK
jgi:NitT/TauT family transport system substrate-binding protein